MGLHSEIDRICRHVIVSGRVQGVSYRYATREKACELGITGWVRNLMDGRVEAVIEGDRPQIECLVKWFEVGPALAKVSDLQIQPHELEGFTSFKIWQ